MTETSGNVKYYKSGDYYTVGDNSTTNADGITDTSYSGEITIEEKIQGKDVIEISRFAFINCKITKITIYAKLRSINTNAFCYCIDLVYINIPSSVTFMGYRSFYLGPEGVTRDLKMTVEFEERTETIFLCIQTFAKRSKFSILYQSKVPPISEGDVIFQVNTPVVCSPTKIQFDSTNTVDLSNCDAPIFKPKTKTRTKNICTVLIIRSQNTGLILFLLISLFTPPITKMITPTIKKSE